MLVILTVTLSLAASSLAAPSSLGSSSQAEIDAEAESLASWAVGKLAALDGGICGKDLASVEKYQTQVVAGTLHTFELLVSHSPSNPASCNSPESGTEKCKLVVFEQVWTNTKEVDWNRSNCN